jgi:hypothetical protein
MRSFQRAHTGVAALRPWPFGPPLRGRAPRRHTGMRDTPSGQGHRAGSAPPASAPAGGLACSPSQNSVL